ncbi:MAG: insulinase family protein [Clostridia bacterium]|nr:insulinase family protein [Clostridia bacterium]
MPQVRMLADKVRMVAIPADRFKTGCISVSMAMPMDGNMAANSLLIYLLKRSCKRYPDFSLLNGKLDELYGAVLSAWVSKNGESQVLNLSIASLADKFALGSESIASESAQLLCELIFAPNCTDGLFSEEALAMEKRLLIQRIEEEMDDKRTYAFERCISCMCKNEAYGKDKYGTVEEIEKVTAADVYAAWQNVLSTAVIQITAVGSADADRISRIFAEGFSAVTRNPVNLSTEYICDCGEPSRTEEKFPVNQGKLVIGFRTSMKHRRDNIFAMTVMNDIFGMGTYSKLFMNVREKLSLAYYCWSRFIAGKGIILVESGIDTEKEKQVTDEILLQLDDLINGRTDPEILDSSKRALRERYTFVSPEGIMNWYSSQILHEEILAPEDMINGFEKVTMEDVCAAAAGLKQDTVFMLSAEEVSDEN